MAANSASVTALRSTPRISAPSGFPLGNTAIVDSVEAVGFIFGVSVTHPIYQMPRARGSMPKSGPARAPRHLTWTCRYRRLGARCCNLLRGHQAERLANHGAHPLVIHV